MLHMHAEPAVSTSNEDWKNSQSSNKTLRDMRSAAALNPDLLRHKLTAGYMPTIESIGAAFQASIPLGLKAAFIVPCASPCVFKQPTHIPADLLAVYHELLHHLCAVCQTWAYLCQQMLLGVGHPDQRKAASFSTFSAHHLAQ